MMEGISVNTQKQLVFIGAGSMAEAIIAGLLQKELLNPQQITVTNRTNKQRLDTLHETYNIQVNQNKNEAIATADIIILAIKPKDVVEGISEIAPYIQPDQLVISVLAGVGSDTIVDLLKQDMAVVRAMPNTSATIGKSATALSVGKYANASHLETARQLFETIGIVSVVDEIDLHAVTGLSGSGPAYVYYMVEAMEQAAAEIGLKQNVAKELILETIIGAAEMLKTSSKPSSQLRKEVTSAGGTTEAGINVLGEYNYQEALIACIKRATERSTELGESLHQHVINQK